MALLWILFVVSEIAFSSGVIFVLYLACDPLVRQQIWGWLLRGKRVTGPLKSGMVLIGGPVLMGTLVASFAWAWPTLQHLDPVLFCVLLLLPLAPLAGWILLRTHRTWPGPAHFPLLHTGIRGGCLLTGGLLCEALSLRTLGMVPNALFTTLAGVLVSLLAWRCTGARLNGYGLLAVLCALAGAGLLWWIAPGHWQRDLLAAGCGDCIVGYGLLVKRGGLAAHSWRETVPFFGSLFAAMVLTALLLALCFGDWTSLRTLTGTDLLILAWCGLGTVTLPVIVLTLWLHRCSAVTLALLALIVPLVSLLWATALGSLSLSLWGWMGVGCLLLSLLIHIRAVALASALTQPLPQEQASATGEGEAAPERR